MIKEFDYEHIDTPCYLFDIQILRNTISEIRNMLGNIRLTYSIKANPVIVGTLTSMVDYVEVCSPGELKLCISGNIDPTSIIYSGVVKDRADVAEAIEYGVRLITAESYEQYRLIAGYVMEKKVKVKLLLRLTSGNQFGMNDDDIIRIYNESCNFGNYISVEGIHYYSGTQKNKISKIEEDIETIENVVRRIRRETRAGNLYIEYGPGTPVNYFSSESDDSTYRSDLSYLKESVSLIDKLNGKDTTIGLEFGRIIAAYCGRYVTKVKDIKNNNNTMYVLTDGGIHQLNYYGQSIGRRVPSVSHIYNQSEHRNINEEKNDIKECCICGSLCTLADVMINKTEMSNVKIGDYLVFNRCGAYSATESSMLFLSRDFPSIYEINDQEVVLVRRRYSSYPINGGFLDD